MPREVHDPRCCDEPHLKGSQVEAHIRMTKQHDDAVVQEYIIDVTDGGGHAITLKTRYAAMEHFRAELIHKARAVVFDCT